MFLHELLIPISRNNPHVTPLILCVLWLSRGSPMALRGLLWLSRGVQALVFDNCGKAPRQGSSHPGGASMQFPAELHGSTPRMARALPGRFPTMGENKSLYATGEQSQRKANAKQTQRKGKANTKQPHNKRRPNAKQTQSTRRAKAQPTQRRREARSHGELP